MKCVRCKREIPDESLFCLYCGKKHVNVPVQRKKRRRPRGTGTVYKMKNDRPKPWVAIRDHVYLGSFATSAEAVLFLDKFNAEHPYTKAEQTPAENMTFAEVYALWKPGHDRMVGDSAKAQSEIAYAKAKSLHSKKMKSLKTADYQRIVDSLVDKGLSLSTCQKQQQLFSMLCQYAMQLDIIDKNYASFIKFKATEKNPEKRDRVFTHEEIEKIKEFSEKPSRLQRTAKILVVLLYTGMRVTELLTITRDNTHVDEEYFIGGIKTDAGKNRIIPMNEYIVPIVKEWLAAGEGNTYLIETDKHKPMNRTQYLKSFYSLMETLGIEGTTVHSARHTCATMLAEAGVAPEIAKSILGHASITTTLNVYTHPRIEKLKDGINKL